MPRVKRVTAVKNRPQADPGPLARELLRSLMDGEPGVGKSLMTLRMPVEAIFLPEPMLRIYLVALAAQQTDLPFLETDPAQLAPLALRSVWIARTSQVRAGGKTVCHPFQPVVVSGDAIVGASTTDAVEMARGMYRHYWRFPDKMAHPGKRVVIPPPPGWGENRPCYLKARREAQLAALRQQHAASEDSNDENAQ